MPEMSSEHSPSNVAWSHDQEQLLSKLVTQHMFDFDAVAKDLQSDGLNCDATACRLQFASQYKKTADEESPEVSNNNADIDDESLPQLEVVAAEEPHQVQQQQQQQQKQKKKKKKKKNPSKKQQAEESASNNVEEAQQQKQEKEEQERETKREEIRRKVELAKKLQLEQEKQNLAQYSADVAQRATEEIRKEMANEQAKIRQDTENLKQNLVKQREEDEKALQRFREMQAKGKVDEAKMLAAMTPEERERHHRIKESLRLYREQRSSQTSANSSGSAEEKLMAIAERFAQSAMTEESGADKEDDEICEKMEALMRPQGKEEDEEEEEDEQEEEDVESATPAVKVTVKEQQLAQVPAQGSVAAKDGDGRFDFEAELARMMREDEGDDYEFRFVDPEEEAKDFQGFDALFADLEARDKQHRADEHAAAAALLKEHYAQCSPEDLVREIARVRDAASHTLTFNGSSSKQSAKQGQQAEAKASTLAAPMEITDDMSFAEMMAAIQSREKFHEKKRNKVFEDVLSSLGGETLEDVKLPPSIMNLFPNATKKTKAKTKKEVKKGKKGKKNRK